MGKKSYLAMLCSLLLVFTSVPFSASAEIPPGSNVVWSLDTSKMGTPGTIANGEYLQGTDGMYQPGIQVADKSSSSMAMYNDGSLGINPSGGTYKAINIQTGTAVQGTDYYTNNGFKAEAGKTYTITFNAYVADGSGQVRVRGNKATDTAANGTWSTTDISKVPTSVSYTWTQDAAGGNMQIDTGSTAQGTIVHLSDLQITASNEAPADKVVWSLDTSKLGVPGTTSDGEYLQGTDGAYQPGIQIADKGSSSMAMYDGGSLGINPSGGTYKAINIQTGTAVGGTNYYATSGFVAEANKTYSVTFSVYVGDGNGEVRVRGNNAKGTWSTTNISSAPTPVSYTWTQNADGGNMQIDTGSTAQGTIVYLTDLQITTKAGGSTTPSEEVVVAYDLQQDTGLADLVSRGGNTYLARAGNLTIDAESDTNGMVSLNLSNRTLNYDGVDVKAPAIGLKAEADYTVEMTGHIPDSVTIPSDAQIVLGGAGPSYATLKSVDAARTFTLSYSGTAAAGTGETSGLRIQADPGLSRFVIDTLVVKVKGGIAMPLKPLPNVPGVHVSLTSNGDSWSGANIILGTDSSVWPFSTGDTVAFTPVKDTKYHLTFNATSTGATGYRVRWITGNDNGGYTAGDAAVVTADPKRTYEVGVTANGLPASFAGAGVVQAQAIDYAIDFTMSGNEPAQGLIGNIGIRGTSGSSDFMLNNIKITDDSGTVLVNWKSNSSSEFVPDDYEWPEAKWDLSLPSLKDAYSEYFQVGNIMEPAQTTNATLTAMYDKQYNAVTAENSMKPENLLKNISSASDLSDTSKYNFAGSDQIVQWAEDNNQSIHGHTLVWHSQTPAFINTGASGTRAAAKANMETFITNVITHFDSPNLISWDVVNEAFDDDTSKFVNGDWRTGLRTSSPWYVAYATGADENKGESGADFMYDAFVFAHLAQDQIGSKATLYYNDYNETYKYKEIALMVEDLNAQWEQDSLYDGRKLIEGIGMQSHFWIGSKPDVNAQEVETTIQRFIETGARISVSELDIPYSENKNYHLDKAKLAEQAKEYGTLFEIYKKYADNIDRVTFWGKADVQSWRGSGMPLLFDNSYRPKAAFWAVIGLDAPISTISPETVTFYTNSQADAKVNITLNSNTLSAIRKGSVLLVEGKEYSVAAASANGTQVVTIKKSYLATLSNNDVLTFEFSAGNTADLTILVTRYTSTDTTQPGPGSTTNTGPGANSGSTPDSNSGTDSGSTEQTPTPEKPLLNSKLVDAEQLKAALQQALQANEPIKFSDVPATHWAAKAVQLASQLGLIKGEADGTFHGADNVTRAEFATMIVRALGLNTTGADGSFSDTDGHWADANIRALHRAGIVNGTGDGNFKPDQKITRAEMAAILARLLNMSAANGTKFSDIDGNWAAEYINQLSQAGIVNGVGDSKFAPDAAASRYQSAAMIMRMLNIVLDLRLNL
jgi:GH35 family endo-1,4-beta-xylanase